MTDTSTRTDEVPSLLLTAVVAVLGTTLIAGVFSGSWVVAIAVLLGTSTVAVVSAVLGSAVDQ